jgi:hypothetical protein
VGDGGAAAEVVLDAGRVMLMTISLCGTRQTWCWRAMREARG